MNDSNHSFSSEKNKISGTASVAAAAAEFSKNSTQGFFSGSLSGNIRYGGVSSDRTGCVLRRSNSNENNPNNDNNNNDNNNNNNNHHHIDSVSSSSSSSSSSSVSVSVSTQSQFENRKSAKSGMYIRTNIELRYVRCWS